MALRLRVGILDRASAVLELRPARRDDIIRLAQRALEVREAVAAL